MVTTALRAIPVTNIDTFRIVPMVTTALTAIPFTNIDTFLMRQNYIVFI